MGGPIPTTNSRAFTSADGGTRVTVRYGTKARGCFKLPTPLSMWFGRRQVEGDLPKLEEMMNVAPPAR